DGEAEHLAFGTTHAELGACLLGTWGLPLELIRAIARHHTPSEENDAAFSVLTVVHASNALEHGNSGTAEGATCLKLDRHYLSRLSLNERYMRWRDLSMKLAQAA